MTDETAPQFPFWRSREVKWRLMILAVLVAVAVGLLLFAVALEHAHAEPFPLFVLAFVLYVLVLPLLCAADAAVTVFRWTNSRKRLGPAADKWFRQLFWAQVGLTLLFILIVVAPALLRWLGRVRR